MPRQKHKYNERIDLGYGPDGKRIRKWIRADTKPDLEALKYEVKKEYEAIRNPSLITFGAYAEKWFQVYKSKKSQSTQDMYRNIINKFDDIKLQQLRNITSSDLQAIINENFDHVRTCEQIKLTLKQIYKQAIKDGIIYPLNIAEDLELPQPVKKEMRFISDDEMKKIVKCDLDPLDRSYMELLRNTGVRPSEGLALKWSDIDLSDQVIHIQRSFEYLHNKPVIKSTKNRTCRDIPINGSFASFLDEMPREGEFVFLWNKMPFVESAYQSMARRILRAINESLGGNKTEDKLAGMTMYSFRHTYATFLYYNGVKPGLISTKKAAQIMGHSEQIFLSRYTHIDDSKESLAEIVKKLDLNLTVSCPDSQNMTVSCPEK